MATEVVHGRYPTFQAPIGDGSYHVTIWGHYTQVENLTAAGVTDYGFASTRPEKRQAELLGLRTAFIDWFILKWVEYGGTFEDAVHHLGHYPYHLHDRRVP